MVVVGIDEVGRGCWAGPLVAAAVVLDSAISGLTDSKLLSKKRREYLATVIHKEAKALGIGWVDARDIDEKGLTVAVRTAMTEALSQINAEYNEIIIDGHVNYLPHNPMARAVIKADMSVAAVSAASIIAKVARDSFMMKAAAKYPGYGFEKHVGYGTKVHLAALTKMGPCGLHRLSYRPVKASA